MRVSWSGGPEICGASSELMRDLDIRGDVVASISSLHGHLERGAVITVWGGAEEEERAVSQLWPALRDRFQLRCAHLRRPGFSGCVHELSGGRCPHA